MTKNKLEKGQYYTVGNPFELSAFKIWTEKCGITDSHVIEPFAGRGDIPELMKHAGIYTPTWAMYDIEPKNGNIQQRDTLLDFPSSYDICITNPPWLAKNSATRKNLTFPKDIEYDDIYKYALEKCLENCKWVAAIMPESYIRSELFFDRLTDFVSLLSDTGKMFDDTEHPVCLALFRPDTSDKIRIWRDNTPLGTLKGLKQYLPRNSDNKNIKFNDENGNLGLIAVDNTVEASIRFCEPFEIPDGYVNYQRRSKTRISVSGEPDINAYNYILKRIRQNTHDVFLTAFKGVRYDGLYRRRLDWALARDIIDSVDSTQTTIRI